MGCYSLGSEAAHRLSALDAEEKGARRSAAELITSSSIRSRFRVRWRRSRGYAIACSRFTRVVESCGTHYGGLDASREYSWMVISTGVPSCFRKWCSWGPRPTQC